MDRRPKLRFRLRLAILAIVHTIFFTKYVPVSKLSGAAFVRKMQTSFALSSSFAPVAQLDRALACGAKGRRFESYRVYHCLIKLEISSSGPCCLEVRAISVLVENLEMAFLIGARYLTGLNVRFNPRRVHSAPNVFNIYC